MAQVKEVNIDEFNKYQIDIKNPKMTEGEIVKLSILFKKLGLIKVEKLIKHFFDNKLVKNKDKKDTENFKIDEIVFNKLIFVYHKVYPPKKIN